MNEKELDISEKEREFILQMVGINDLSDEDVSVALRFLQAGKICNNYVVTSFFRYPFLLRCGQIYPKMTVHKIHAIIIEELESRNPSCDLRPISNKLRNSTIDGALILLEEFYRQAEAVASQPSAVANAIDNIIQIRQGSVSEEQKSAINIARFVDEASKVLSHRERLGLLEQVNDYCCARIIFSSNFPLELLCKAFKRRYRKIQDHKMINLQGDQPYWSQYFHPVYGEQGVSLLVLDEQRNNTYQQFNIDDFADLFESDTDRESSVQRFVEGYISRHFSEEDSASLEHRQAIAHMIVSLNQQEYSETFCKTLERYSKHHVDLLNAIAPAQQHLMRQMTHAEKDKDQAALNEMVHILASEGTSLNFLQENMVLMAYDLYWYTGGSVSMISIYRMLNNLDLGHYSSPFQRRYRLVSTNMPFTETYESSVTRSFYSSYSESVTLNILRMNIVMHPMQELKDRLFSGCGLQSDKRRHVFYSAVKALPYQFYPYIKAAVCLGTYVLLVWACISMDVSVYMSKSFYEYYMPPFYTIDMFVQHARAYIRCPLRMIMCFLVLLVNPIMFFSTHASDYDSLQEVSDYWKMIQMYIDLSILLISIFTFIYVFWFSSLYIVPVDEFLKQKSLSVTRWYMDNRFYQLEVSKTLTFSRDLVRTWSDKLIAQVSMAILISPHLTKCYQSFMTGSIIPTSSMCFQMGYNEYIQPYVKTMGDHIQANCSKLWGKSNSLEVGSS